MPSFYLLLLKKWFILYIVIVNGVKLKGEKWQLIKQMNVKAAMLI
jgi:hypothetical protein